MEARTRLRRAQLNVSTSGHSTARRALGEHTDRQQQGHVRLVHGPKRLHERPLRGHVETSPFATGERALEAPCTKQETQDGKTASPCVSRKASGALVTCSLVSTVAVKLRASRCDDSEVDAKRRAATEDSGDGVASANKDQRARHHRTTRNRKFSKYISEGAGDEEVSLTHVRRRRRAGV